MILNLTECVGWFPRRTPPKRKDIARATVVISLYPENQFADNNEDKYPDFFHMSLTKVRIR